jgi:biopolymer transport protein ExbD
MKKKKKKFTLPESEVNVVPLMDILTTMLFFLILMASTSNLSSLLAKSDILGSSEETDKKPKFDMAIMIKDAKKVSIHLSDISKLKVINKDQFSSYLKRNFRWKGDIGFEKVIRGKNIGSITPKLVNYLIKIKKAFPHEQKVTLVLSDKILYEDIIKVMDLISNIPDDSKSFPLTNFLGQTRNTTVLFPEISLQELGES